MGGPGEPTSSLVTDHGRYKVSGNWETLAGLKFAERSAGPRIMGILNVTPNSFSDGGAFLAPEEATRRADELLTAGADLIDIGGESTRPFAPPVPAAEELQRVIPVIKAIRRQHPAAVISVDTTKAVVAREALAAGADLINDISALRFDPEMAAVLRESEVPVVIMHMQGTPADMQVAPRYRDVVAEIKEFLAERIAWLAEQGIAPERVIIDPGIGFGKSVAHNLTIINRLAEFRALGRPLLVGHSRKSFIGKILDLAEPAQRDQPTAVLAAICALRGADLIRVHEVAATRQALRLTAALIAANEEKEA